MLPTPEHLSTRSFTDIISINCLYLSPIFFIQAIQIPNVTNIFSGSENLNKSTNNIVNFE